jgi:von Willebrand factor type A domain
MLAFTFVFLTPLAAVLAVLALLPLAALALGARRVAVVRRALRLAPAPGRVRLWRQAALAGIVGLLAVAAMQPVIKTERGLDARTDAQLFVVLDTSRSMAAAESPNSLTRLARAKRIAIDLGTQIGDLPAGVATFTDRVLPDLFPTADHAAFDSTVSSVQVEDPPPENVSTVATSFDNLAALATSGFFPDGVHKRVVVLVTDGESAPFDPGSLASVLASHGVRLIAIRVGDGRDRVWTPSGKPEAAYRPDPAGARRSLAELESALGDPRRESATSFVRRAVGSGPSATIGAESRTVTLAPIPAVLALVLLIVIFRPTRSGQRYGFRAGRTNERVSA